MLDRLKISLKESEKRGDELYVFADTDSHVHDVEQIHVLRRSVHYGNLSPVQHELPLQLRDITRCWRSRLLLNNPT